MHVLSRQRGMFNLYWVAIFSAAAAALAMFALMSMRSEHNLFADGVDHAKATFAKHGGEQALGAARDAVTGTDSRMKKCTINGKVVISNTDCLATNSSTKVIVITDGNVANAVKPPKKPVAAPTSQPVIDKIIEKQLN